jgi:hypothetical protein
VKAKTVVKGDRSGDGHFVVGRFVEFLESDGDAFDLCTQLRDQAMMVPESIPPERKTLTGTSETR